MELQRSGPCGANTGRGEEAAKGLLMALGCTAQKPDLKEQHLRMGRGVLTVSPFACVKFLDVKTFLLEDNKSKSETLGTDSAVSSRGRR